MASVWTTSGAGALTGFQQQLAQQREEELLRQRAAQMAETVRSNQAGEMLRGRQLDEGTAARQDALSAREAQARMVNEDRDQARVLGTLNMRSIGSPVTLDERNREQQAGAPSSLYDEQAGQPLPDGQQGPPVPTIAFRGTGAQQRQQQVDRSMEENRTRDDARAQTTHQDQVESQRLQREQIATQQAESNRLRQEGLTNTKENQAFMRGIAGQREGRLTENGPVTTIADPNSPSGARVISRRDLPQGGAPAPAPGALRTTEIQNDVSTTQLDRLEQMFNPEFVGPYAGRANQTKQQLPDIPGIDVPGMGVPSGFADFSAATAAFRNQVIKAITGAQMSETEAGRIRQQIPEVSDAPNVWKAKAQQTRANLADLARRLATKAPAQAERPNAGAGPGGGGRTIGRFTVVEEP